MGFPGGSDSKESTCNAGDSGSIRVQKISWRRRFSSSLAWRIPWAEEPGGLQSMGLQRVPRNWGTTTFTFWVIWWNLTPGQSCVGCESSLCQHILPLSHLETISIIRSTAWYHRCLCSSHPYFIYQWLQSTRVVMLAIWICQRIALKCLLEVKRGKFSIRIEKQSYSEAAKIFSPSKSSICEIVEKKRNLCLFCCSISNCEIMTTVHGKPLQIERH